MTGAGTITLGGDLVVDRSRMFEALKNLRAWIPLDGTYDLGPGPRLSPEVQQFRYALDRCITCGCCLEVCPQIHRDDPPGTGFVGAAAIAQALLMNLHPTGQLNADERLDALMGPGGVASCGNAQNCVSQGHSAHARDRRDRPPDHHQVDQGHLRTMRCP